MNKQGRRTTKLLDKLRAARHNLEERGPLTPAGDIGPMLEQLDHLFETGQWYEEAWKSLLHDDSLLPPSPDARAFEQEWVAWDKEGKNAVTLLNMPPDAQLEAIRRWQDTG
jgi:hypothetical protein